MIKPLFQTLLADRHLDLARYQAPAWERTGWRLLSREPLFAESCSAGWSLGTRWWRSARSTLFIVILGFLVSFGPIQAVRAQDVSEKSVATNQRFDLRPARFWFSAAPSSSGNVWDAPAPEVITAIILDINSQEILFASEKDTAETRLPSARLQAIDVNWASDSGRKAHSAFVSDDFKAVIELSKTAIASGDLPRWQQRILAAELTESLTNLDKTSIACSVFISLCKESPAPMLYASAPLNWTSERADTALAQKAKEWLGQDKDQNSQLLGASWLLIGSDESRRATSSLENLSRSKSVVISQLAAAQLWRTAPPNQVIEQYSPWSALRDRMPLPLQLGPTIAIAHKLEKAGQSEAALQEWLRVVSIYPEHRKSFVQACDASVELLKRLGRNDEAKTVELIQRRD